MPFLYYNESYNKKAINLTIQIRINLNHKYHIKKMPPLVMSKDDEDKDSDKTFIMSPLAPMGPMFTAIRF